MHRGARTRRDVREGKRHQAAALQSSFAFDCSFFSQLSTICYVEADGTGIPRVARELEGRQGRQADGSASTREVKLGCVFSQTKTDEEGRPHEGPVEGADGEG